MKSSNLRNIKFNLLYVTSFYLKHADFKKLGKESVQKLHDSIKNNSQLQIGQAQLKDLIVCALFYEDNQDLLGEDEHKLPESNVDSLLVFLASNFAKTMPTQKAMQIASVLATHKPNNPSDIDNILDM